MKILDTSRALLSFTTCFSSTFWDQSQQPLNDVQMIPPTMGTALGPVNYGARTPVPKEPGTVGPVDMFFKEAVCTKMYYT